MICSHRLREGAKRMAVQTYIQAALEEAKRTEANLCFSSWDMKRAFDSVSKKALKLAYSR